LNGLRKNIQAQPSAEAVVRSSSLAQVQILTVDENYHGQRLDNFLVRFCRGVPKSHVYQLIRSGQVRVNGGRATADRRLASGDRVRIPPVRGLAEPPTPSSLASARSEAPARPVGTPPALKVLFEDEHILVVNKPAGLAVHGGSGISRGAIEWLRLLRPNARFLELAHRLDRETSGILVIACRRAALLGLHQQFRDRALKKSYLAIASGRWPLRTRSIDAPLQRLPAQDGDRRVQVWAGGQEALTRVTGLYHLPIAGIGEFSLVKAQIETGRTHQIRVHFAHEGKPVAGDDKYGDYGLNRLLAGQGLKRMFLHAHSLALHHPIDGRPLLIEAAPPEAFSAFFRAAGCDEAQVFSKLARGRVSSAESLSSPSEAP
jgi:23S rRNA pseudouridine955/2504/2580 synthase